MRVYGSGCRVQGAGFRVQGPGFRVQGAGCRGQGAGLMFRVQGAGCRGEDADRRHDHEVRRPDDQCDAVCRKRQHLSGVVES